MCIKTRLMTHSWLLLSSLFFSFGLLRVCVCLTDSNSSPISAVGQSESGFTRFLFFGVAGIDGLFVRFCGCSE